MALQALAAHHRGSWEHMGAEERTLRRRLRAHGRQLGDRRDPHSGNQTIDHLAHECAYEHWHGMLFARFLAENHLLIEPELGVAVTLEDCEELGGGRGGRQMDDGGALRPRDAAPGVPPRSTGLRGPSRPGTPAEAGGIGGEPSRRRFPGRGLPRLGVPVLAIQEEGRGEPLGLQGRGGRAAGGDPALHRALHGELPARQLSGALGGRRAA